jgi:hypothetical protein
MDEVAVKQIGFAELNVVQSSQQLAEEISQLTLGQLVAKAEVRAAAPESEVRVG